MMIGNVFLLSSLVFLKTLPKGTLAFLSSPTSNRHGRRPLQSNSWIPQQVETTSTLNPSCRPTSKRYSTDTESDTIKAGDSDDEPNDEATKASKTTQVKFIGKKRIVTPPVSLNPQAKPPREFFLQSQHRNLLMAKDENDVQIIPSLTEEQIKIWSSESSSAGGPIISPKDLEEENSTFEVLAVKSSVKFPGLTMETVSLIGCNLLVNTEEEEATEKSTNLPKYEFTLIKTTQTVQGPKPVVWIYEKLTSAQPTSEEGMVSSFTTVKMERVQGNGGDDDENEVVFITDARLEVRVKFPSVLMKILPMSVEKLETSGSASIQKAVEKDLGSALERFQLKYCEWMER